MANTFNKIASVSVGSGGAASISFTSIPQTYTDLVLKWSTRTDNNPYSSPQNWEELNVNSNGAMTNLVTVMIRGSGGGGSVTSTGGEGIGYATTTGATSGIFSNSELYISNYTSSVYKPMILDTAAETHSATVFLGYQGITWSQTGAITSLVLTPRAGTSANYVQYSTATLYGIKNS